MDAEEGEGLAADQRCPKTPASSSYTAERLNQGRTLHYSMYRGQPPLSQSLRPAGPPKERERGAGESPPPLKIHEGRVGEGGGQRP
jgi:hypothetical protein